MPAQEIRARLARILLLDPLCVVRVLPGWIYATRLAILGHRPLCLGRRSCVRKLALDHHARGQRVIGRRHGRNLVRRFI
jgi:hypothetical protein